MAEIRLVCPGCAAEYRLSDTAIPPQGREVECSACGHVWHATATPARLALIDAMPPARTQPTDTPPAGAPGPLSRPLPPSVLDILRDEVEHERRARAAETGAPAQEATEARRSPADPDWPATTITRHIDPRPAPAETEQPPEPAAAVPAGEPARAAAIARSPVRPTPAVPAAEPAQRPRPGAAPRRDRYATGFGLAVMLAAIGVVLYVMAPALADQGPLGEAFAQARAQMDGARLWLQDRADLLLR